MLNILSIMEKIHDIQKGIRKVRMSDDNINRSNFCNRIEKYVEMFDKEYERDSVLEVIFEARADGALREELKKDGNFQQKEKEIGRIVKRIEKAGLDREQWHIVDEALSACNDKDSQYARAAYCLGFKDGVRLAMEIFK